MVQKVTQYTQDIQFLNRAYQYLKIGDKSSDCVNVTNKTISAHKEENKCGNEDEESNNHKRNTSIDNKSVDKNASKRNN